MKTLFWNLRFCIGWAILPGVHKHVRVGSAHDECDQAGCA